MAQILYMEERPIRLTKQANRILFVRNLPRNVDGQVLYDLFGPYGPIRQIRLGNIPTTATTAYVVYESVYDAQRAKDALNGFTMENRYLIVQYHDPQRLAAK